MSAKDATANTGDHPYWIKIRAKDWVEEHWCDTCAKRIDQRFVARNASATQFLVECLCGTLNRVS